MTDEWEAHARKTTHDRNTGPLAEPLAGTASSSSSPIKVCGHCGLRFRGSTWCPDCHATDYEHTHDKPEPERLILVGAWDDAATAALAWAGQCGYGECAPEVPSPATLAYLKAWGLVA